MGWWTDLKHAADSVQGLVEHGADLIVPGAGLAIAGAANAIGAIGDKVRDGSDAAKQLAGRAPSGPPPPPPPSMRPPAASDVRDINGTQVWQVLARAQIGKWMPSEIPTLTDNANYEIKEGGKAPTYPGLIWNAAAKTYTQDPKGVPVIKTTIVNGREMATDDAAFLAKRDAQWTQDFNQRQADANGAPEDEARQGMAKKHKTWLLVGGGVAVAVAAVVLIWALSKKK